MPPSIDQPTKAEFKTRREALGLTPKFLGERIGCHENIIWRTESPLRPGSKVSERAGAELASLALDWDMAAERLAVAAREVGFIERGEGAAGFVALVPELATWPERSHGLLLAEVQRRTNLPIKYGSE